MDHQLLLVLRQSPLESLCLYCLSGFSKGSQELCFRYFQVAYHGREGRRRNRGHGLLAWRLMRGRACRNGQGILGTKRNTDPIFLIQA
jgi:hypothetical protein